MSHNNLGNMYKSCPVRISPQSTSGPSHMIQSRLALDAVPLFLRVARDVFFPLCEFYVDFQSLHVLAPSAKVSIDISVTGLNHRPIS